jgi:hypothetical protein
MSRGAIDDACREIRRHVLWAEQRHRERERLRQLVRLTDQLVCELEQLNLEDVERVDAGWRRRLELLFASLPFPYRPWLRAHPSPSQVLDVLFDVQVQLLDLKRKPCLAAIDARL